MRLTLLLNNLQGGGGERAHVMLANGLAAIGHDVELIVVSREGPCDALIAPAVRVTDLGMGRAALALPALISALRRSRADLVISAMVIPNVLAALASYVVPGITLIAVEHGDLNEVYHADKGQLAARVGYKLVPSVYGRFDRIFCVDRSTAISVAAFTRRLDLPIRVMPNAVIGPDVDARMAEPADHPWVGGDVPLFLNIGRMADQKNQSLLLRAFARVAREREARLIILGDGPLRRELEAERDALGLAGRVDMPGFRDPFPYLKRADAFVLSSRWEALPTVVIEALYCGCPAIVTKASMGTLELVGYGRNGRIAEEASEAALAAEMLGILAEPPARAALHAQGARYRLDRVARLYESEFAELLTAKPARAA